jgi:CheY-like chemotaxis protein/HPt (histidine-containing phosphotransfer) domain-containing protein
VINYILDVSKIEADEGLKIQALNLGELIASTLEIVAASAREKGLAVRSRIDPALGPCHEADPDRLQQILLNLLVNAIKFTDEGSVSVEALPATAPECSVRFEVNDTGVGIDKTNQTRIFAPFVSQGNIGESSSAQGTGLGLDIVSRSVQAMGGRVGVSSAPGAGSSFWVELPLAEAASDVASDARWHSAEAPREAVESIDARVMLVDDNETNLMLGTMIFESLGMTVTPVSSGAEAVQLADPAKQDLIFMDISMPGMDGYEATRLIRQRFSAKSLPVIALSAYASSVENRKAQDAGMNDYLVKPMNLDDGVAVIRSHLPADRLRLTGGVEHDSHTESVLIDEQTLRDLKRQIGQESLNTVIGKFLGEARSRWALLQGGVDSESRGREAHTLASTCSSFGLTPVADALRAVEARARNCEIEESEQLDRINALLEQSLTRLSAVVSQL